MKRPGALGPHDVGGEEIAGGIDRSRKYQLWEKEVHAVAVGLIKVGRVTIDEIRRAVEALDADLYADLGYYEKWAAAVTALSIEHKFFTRAEMEAALGPAPEAAVHFKVGDKARIRHEHPTRRWRKPHLRIPGYVHGVAGTVVEVMGAFDDPSYRAFSDAQPIQQPLYRLELFARDLWGTTVAADCEDTIIIDVFQQWLEPFTGGPTRDPSLPAAPAPYAGCGAAAAVDTGVTDRSHLPRGELEQLAVAEEAPDAPLQPLARALVSLLTEENRGLGLSKEFIRGIVEGMDKMSTTTPLGAVLVAKAWVDPAFKARLMVDAEAAADEFGIDTTNYGKGHVDMSLYPPDADADPKKPKPHTHSFGSGHTRLHVVDNTPEKHNLIVCTLCSCYPSAVLGQSPDWYRGRYYRARAVRDPRGLLKDDFGLTLPSNRRIVVHDSTAEARYLVLPMRPEGTEGLSEKELAELVTRDAMIGVAELAPYRAPAE